MTKRPENLPDYRRPPIDEVAIAVQFQEIEGCTTESLRSFWRTVRNDYPFVENRPPIEIPIESDEQRAGPSVIQIPLSIAPSQNMRLWLIGDADDFLIQVQNSTLVQNWRKRGLEYPRFEEVRARFWASFSKFRDFNTGLGLEHPVVRQIEVTYINWIPDLPISEFLNLGAGSRLNLADSRVDAEEQAWQARYRISSGPNVVSRLHVQAFPGIRNNDVNNQGVQFSLIVRSATESSGGMKDDEAAALIDEARMLIVQSFASLTTRGAQDHWERLS